MTTSRQHWPVYHAAIAGEGNDGVAVVQGAKANAKAVASLIFGALSGLLIPLALANLILAPFALRELSLARGRQTGRGMAVVGLLLSVLSLVGWGVIVTALILFAVFR